MQKLDIPKGTRDFSPREVRRRYYIIDVIRKHFERFGFAPIETPSFENLSVLTGKYGRESERLIFKILNSGDFMKNSISKFDPQKNTVSECFNTQALLPEISEKALRYDLTIPLARYVVMHRNDIHLPFKRYQIQAVWRADNPQRGRFREFYQCDADSVGSGSLWQEVEFLQLYDAVFTELELPVNIQINHRELLYSLAQHAKLDQKHWCIFTTTLDKWDKIGQENVYQEMSEKGISKNTLEKLKPFFQENTDFESQHTFFSKILIHCEKGKKALSELNFIWQHMKNLGMQSAELCFNPKLARGLDYYTGIICEVLIKDMTFSSVGGGGRYDELTGVFGLKNLSAAGISFGLDRIHLAMEALELFNKTKTEMPLILFANFGELEALESMLKIQALRKKGIPSELYPKAVSLRKQLEYAGKKGACQMALIGKNEMDQGTLLVKNLTSGAQTLYKDLDQLAKDYFELIK